MIVVDIAILLLYIGESYGETTPTSTSTSPVCELSTQPNVTTLHVNNDGNVPLWTGGPELAGCSNCLLVTNDGDLFELDATDFTVYKKNCTQCLNATTYYYQVQCYEKTSENYSLGVVDDSDPPFGFHASIGGNINVSKTITVNSVVNQIVSNPVDSALVYPEYDTVTFSKNDTDPSWLTVDPSTGNITVNGSVTDIFGPISVTFCATNRRMKPKCGVLTVTILDPVLDRTGPTVTQLHENTDGRISLWNVAAQCDVTYSCFDSFICSKMDECNTCSTNSSMFESDGTTIYKAAVSNQDCTTAAEDTNCGVADRSHVYSVSCQYEGAESITSGTASQFGSLTFTADDDPPISFYNASVAIGKSINADSIVNKVISDPVNSSLPYQEFDTVTFMKTSTNPTWLIVEPDTGLVVVNDTVTDAASSFDVDIVATNRRGLNKTATFSVTILHSHVNNGPTNTSLHENTDVQVDVWSVNATCDVTFPCGDFTCSDNVPCDTCYTNNPLFGTNGTTVFKKECNDHTCDNACDIAHFCLNADNPNHTYNITCEKNNTFGYTNITSGRPSEGAFVNVVGDMNPPFSFTRGTSITVGRSIEGNDNLVNKILSDPIDNLYETDRVTFNISSIAPPGLTWLYIDPTTGEIKVNGSLESETNTQYTVQFCATNRRNLYNCGLLDIQILYSNVTSEPFDVELHENTDAKRDVWHVTAMCDITFECPGDTNYTCADVVACDSCVVYDQNNLFDTEPKANTTFTVFKRQCEQELCDSCDISKHCVNGGESYNYTVSCVRNDTVGHSGFTTGNASLARTLSLFNDIYPSSAYDNPLNATIQVGKSILGIGELINKVISQPNDTEDDNDKPRFYFGPGYNPSWLKVDETNGDIRVVNDLSAEEATHLLLEICVENRRHQNTCQPLDINILHTNITSVPNHTELHENTDSEKRVWTVTATIDVTFLCGIYTCAKLIDSDFCTLVDFEQNGLYEIRTQGIEHHVYKKECDKKFCHPCNIADHCVNANETHPYGVDCVKNKTVNEVNFTTGHATQNQSIFFYPDTQPSFIFENYSHVVVLQNDSKAIVNKMIPYYINETDDNDTIAYYTKITPRPSWIHGNILLKLNTSTGEIYIAHPLDFEFSYTFNMTTCVQNRRNLTFCNSFDITLWACYQTPNCSTQSITINDTYAISDLQQANNTLFVMEYPNSTEHFPDFRSNWANLTWSLEKNGFEEVAIDPLTGEIWVTRNISIWPSWPSRDYNMTVTVTNSESCYTTTCNMEVTIYYINWEPHIVSLPENASLHEDRDEEKVLHILEIYDNNYDRVGEHDQIEDNITCWIDYVHDASGNNDMGLFDLREDTNNTNRWNSYTLYKRKCVVDDSIFTPPCGYLRDNFTCPNHTGCMTHNLTQWYNVSIVCQDGYNATDNRNFTFDVLPNVAPRYVNLPKTITLDLRKGSEHDIIFSTLYTDAENENLTYNYQFVREDSGEDVTYFKGDPSGNYYNQLGNISLTTYLYDTPKNATYKVHICGHERRNEICEYLTVELKDFCGPTPTCSSANNNTNSELPVGTVLFNVEYMVNNAIAFLGLQYHLSTKYINLFEIDPETGVIKTKGLLPATYPSTTYVLNVFVSDSNACGSYSVCPLFVHVNYTNYPLSITNLPNTNAVTIKEDEESTLILYTIATNDQNLDEDVICVITNPEDNEPFYIDETYAGSDVFVIKNWAPGSNANRRLSATKLTYAIHISCNDSLGDGDTGNLTITVIPNTGPSLTTITGTQTKQVDQSTVFNWTTLLVEKATDPDGDSLNYTCTVDSSNNPLTCIMDTSAVYIKLRRTVSILLEDGKVFVIRVCVGDRKHPNHECGNLSVTFETKHSHPSISNLPDTIAVPENTALHTPLFTPQVDDDDIPLEPKTFTMTVSPSGASPFFTLDTQTGNVSLTKPLDYESMVTYSILMKVHDPYLSSLSSKKLVIKVTDANEPNSLHADRTTLTFKESTKVGTKFDFGLTCTDEDFNDVQTLSIISGLHMNYFSINNDDNKMYLQKQWDLELVVNNTYLPTSTIITVQCMDTGSHMSHVQLYFIIEDVNDHKPVLTPSAWPDVLQITSSTPVTKTFMTVTATDADRSSDATFHFGILGNGLGRKYFRMVTKTTSKRYTDRYQAELKLRLPIQLNYHKMFTFNIKVSDNGWPPKFSAIQITVNYTADANVPQASETSNCISCSNTGKTLIAVLVVECVIVGFLIIQTLFALGFFKSRASVKPEHDLTSKQGRWRFNPQKASLHITPDMQPSTSRGHRYGSSSSNDSSSSDSDDDCSLVNTRYKHEGHPRQRFARQSRSTRETVKSYIHPFGHNSSLTGHLYGAKKDPESGDVLYGDLHTAVAPSDGVYMYLAHAENSSHTQSTKRYVRSSQDTTQKSTDFPPALYV